MMRMITMIMKVCALLILLTLLVAFALNIRSLVYIQILIGNPKLCALMGLWWAISKIVPRHSMSKHQSEINVSTMAWKAWKATGGGVTLS